MVIVWLMMVNNNLVGGFNQPMGKDIYGWLIVVNNG